MCDDSHIDIVVLKVATAIGTTSRRYEFRLCWDYARSVFSVSTRGMMIIEFHLAEVAAQAWGESRVTGVWR